MVGTANLAAARLCVIGAISQCFGSGYQDRLSLCRLCQATQNLRMQKELIMAELAPRASAAAPMPGEVEAFIGQVVTDLSAAFSGVLVNVGRKLGLYRAMAKLGPCTSAALAEAAGIRERYVREWLANQAA